MAIVVDAYNVLHCAHVLPAWCALNTATDMCRMLESSRFAVQRCVVVCDGNPKPLEGEYHGPVELRYSGSSSDADTVIEHLIAADHAPRQLIVVSNDRRLMTAARRRRARAMTSETFLHLLITPAKRDRSPDAKPKTIANTDYWLEQFQIDPDEQFTIDEEPAPPPNKSESLPTAVPVPDQEPAPHAEPPDPKSNPQPGETEIQYWLRIFGFTDHDE